MSKTSNNSFFNPKNRINGNNMTQYKNNPNLSNFSKNKKINKANNSYGGENYIGDAGKLNIDENINGADNRYNDTYKMNRTSFGFGPIKKTYEEKLDNFMATHNLKYIEPPKIEKNSIPPIISQKKRSINSNNLNQSKKSNLQKKSNNNETIKFINKI